MAKYIKSKAIFQILIILIAMFSFSYVVSANNGETAADPIEMRDGDTIECTAENPCVYEVGGITVKIVSGTATAGKDGISCPKGCVVSTKVDGREITGQVTELKRVGNTIVGKCGEGGCSAAGVQFSGSTCFKVEGGGTLEGVGASYTSKVTLRGGPGCAKGAELKKNPPAGVHIEVTPENGPVILPDGTIINSGKILVGSDGTYTISGGDVILKNGMHLTGYMRHFVNGDTHLMQGDWIRGKGKIPRKVRITPSPIGERAMLVISPSGEMRANGKFKLEFDFGFEVNGVNRPVIITGGFETQLKIDEPCPKSFKNCISFFNDEEGEYFGGTPGYTMELKGMDLHASVPSRPPSRSSYLAESPIHNLIVGAARDSDDYPITVINDLGRGEHKPKMIFTHDNVVAMDKLKASGIPFGFDNILAYNEDLKGIWLKQYAGGDWAANEVEMDDQCKPRSSRATSFFNFITGAGILSPRTIFVHIPYWCMWLAGAAVVAFAGYEAYVHLADFEYSPGAEEGNPLGAKVKALGSPGFWTLSEELIYHNYDPDTINLPETVKKRRLFVGEPRGSDGSYPLLEVTETNNGFTYVYVGRALRGEDGQVSNIRFIRRDTHRNPIPITQTASVSIPVKKKVEKCVRWDRRKTKCLEKKWVEEDELEIVSLPYFQSVATAPAAPE